MSYIVGRGVKRWSPQAFRSVVSFQKRFKSDESATNHMPWPYTKYKAPAAAKKWLSKYPVSKQDDYEEEFVYLDEIEDRITNHYKTQRQSDRWRQAQNEFAVLGDYEDVDKAYPSGLSTSEQEKVFGRGNKIDPAHYVNPQFINVMRIYQRNLRITPRNQLQHTGTVVGRNRSMPPETASVFKTWNWWHMFMAVGIITVGKEWFILSSHDTHHFMMFYLFTGWAGASLVGTWYWWRTLRMQEYYDQRFLPLQENVDNLFTLLDRLEKKPSLGLITRKYHAYIDSLRERLVTKRVMDTINLKRAQMADLLDKKYKEEQRELLEPPKQWQKSALTDTLKFFEDSAQTDKYFDAALAALSKNGAKLAGKESSTNPSTAVQTKYDELRSKVEKEWYDVHKKANTLPWGFSDEATKKASALSEAQQKEIYNSKLNEMKNKWHKFSTA